MFGSGFSNNAGMKTFDVNSSPWQFDRCRTNKWDFCNSVGEAKNIYPTSVHDNAMEDDIIRRLNQLSVNEKKPFHGEFTSKPNDDSLRLHVSNIPFRCREFHLNLLFAPYG